MGGAAIDGPLRALRVQEAVDQAGRERITAADAVENLDVHAALRLEELVADEQTAPQSFLVAVLALRSVVATTLKLGYVFLAVSIIFLK